MASPQPVTAKLLTAWNHLGFKVSGVLPNELAKANQLRRATLRALSQTKAKS